METKQSESFSNRVQTPKKTTVMGIIAVACLVFVVCLAFGIWFVDSNGTSTQNITDIFIDINGDGLIDYIANAKVIINNGGASFPSSQPKNP